MHAPDPLNQDFSRQSKHHWNCARARAMGLGKERHKGLGWGAWCLTPTHAVAQSAVADIYDIVSLSLIHI